MSNEFVTMEVKGLDQLQEKLEAVNERVARKGIRAALRAGGTVIKAAMVALAPHLTGFLEEHFSQKISIRKDALAGSSFIGPQGKVDYPAFLSGAYNIKRTKTGKARKVGRIAVATVARFLEFGTSKMSKKPFMTQAFESNKEAALDAIVAKLKEALNDDK